MEIMKPTGKGCCGDLRSHVHTESSTEAVSSKFSINVSLCLRGLLGKFNKIINITELTQ